MVAYAHLFAFRNSCSNRQNSMLKPQESSTVFFITGSRGFLAFSFARQHSIRNMRRDTDSGNKILAKSEEKRNETKNHQLCNNNVKKAKTFQD